MLTQDSSICGIQTYDASGWIEVGGPIKGSYAVRNHTDWLYDCITDFGIRVEDPCQAIDNDLKINLNPRNATVKDLKYHLGTDSRFWLTTCTGYKALKFVEKFPSIELSQGNLAITSTPPDKCTLIEMKHRAPDGTTTTNILTIFMANMYEASLEKCSPSHGDCQPNI
jgi:hypothetical protein